MVMLAVATSAFGELLLGFRNARKLDRKVLANASKVSYESIRRYEEEGRKPTEENVRKIARALGENTLKPLLEAAGYPANDVVEPGGLLELKADERVLLDTYRSLPADEQRRGLRYWQRLLADDESDSPGRG